MSIQLKTSSQRILILYIGPVVAEAPIGTTQSVGSNAVSEFLNTLTGTQPPQDVSTLAGYTSHPPLRLKTKYYDTNISIWCDELPNQISTSKEKLKYSKDKERDNDDNYPNATIATESDIRAAQLTTLNSNQDETTLALWLDQMASKAAKEVRGVIGAMILVLPYKQSSIASINLQSSLIASWTPYVECLSTLRDQIEDETRRDLASLIILQDQTHHNEIKSSKHGSDHERDSSTFLESFEDECLSEQGILGWDFVQMRGGEQDADQSKSKTNEYGEKTGIDRVTEVLQAVDWFTSTTENADSGDDSFTEREVDLSFLDYINPSSTNPPQFRGKDREPTHLARDDISQSEQDFQQEIMELKMAMLDVDHNEVAHHAAGEGFGDFTSAFDTDLGDRGKDDDVWAALDRKDSNAEDMLVEDLPGLLERVIAIREAGAEMTSAERERFARREIGRLMEEL